MRAPVSLVLITRNAGAQLHASLDSARFADEVVVVDSGSDDDTVQIAASFGARVIDQPWLGFGPQKQFAVERARHDWVLCLDADERLTPELVSAIESALAAPRAAAYRMARCNRFLGRWLRHGEGYPDWSVRLFDRRRARWSDDVVHERVLCDGPVATLAGDLRHESAESLESYLAKQNRYTTLQAQRLHDQGRSASIVQLLGSPALRFVKFYFVKLGFLDGIAGLVHIVIGCGNSFLKHAKLLALERASRAAARP
ncbi:MAG: glycosyltransferase family 2 protein [Burkholderiales bacterium]|nr:glycosyltransferase family 2 protein [Burkholderiales bacterium]